MKRLLPIALCLGLAAGSDAARMSRDRVYPKFQIGVTGIRATFEKGFVLTVQEVEAGSPAEGKLRKDDVILAAGGRKIEGDDPRIPLGEAVTAAEAKDGKLVLRVRREGKESTVTVTIPVMGPYSKTWPLKCRKSARIIRETAEFLRAAQQPDGAYKIDGRADRDGLWSCMSGLFLLSTGEAKYLPNVRLQAQELAKKAAEHPTGSTWHLGVQGILLGEYYLKTGDKSVLAAMKALCDQAAKTQAAGSWGHGGLPNPGYVQSGLMNSAAVPVLTTLTLARECGVDVDKGTFDRALEFFYRMAGHGSVCYGDHRSELFPNTNGRNGKLACALVLLDGECYQKAAQHLALIFADSYHAPEFGHTGGGFNVMWRGISTVLVPKDRQKHYRRQMDKLAWYYDLARVRGGGFSMLPSPPTTTRYCGRMWGTGCVGLTYTAPLRTLRITGAPPTKFSVKVKVPPRPWGVEADLAFLETDDAKGFDKEPAEPHEVHETLRGRAKDKAPVAFCATMMRHHNPMFRTWAARRLGDRAEKADVDALAEALEHPDPRVRRAACDGFSGYDNWGRATHPNRMRGKVPPAVVSERFLPAILKTLKNPKSAWWEIDGALFALGRAEPADIRKNLDIVKRFAKHEKWYLREAAFWAIVGLRKAITGEEFQLLADIYGAERHVFARSSYDAGFRLLVEGEKVQLPRAAEIEAIKTLGVTHHSAPIAQGYGTAGKHEAAHRTMMILKHFDPRVYEWIVGDFLKYLDTWSPNYQHSVWLITGSPWQPGLLKVADHLGPKAKPLVAALRECLDKKLDKTSKNKATIQCREALEKGLKAYEAKHGK